MKSFLKVAAGSALILLSATAFAGKQPNVGGSGQGTGATTISTNLGSAIAASAGFSGGVSVATAPNGVITVTPQNGGATGGVTFTPTTIAHGGQTFTVSANNGVFTIVPVAE